MSSAEHILARLPEISGACERDGVWRLWAFSSAARGEWREDSSNIEFLVELNPTQPLPQQSFGLYRELRASFGCDIDLVSIGVVVNPYFLEELAQTRVPANAAARCAEAAAQCARGHRA